jgi:MSHA pilin protein MshA
MCRGNKMQHQQRGFTLIELIIVIVILGILAVTAAPKFIDIQSDARASTLQAVKSALQGGGQLIFAKSAIAGQQSLAAAATTLVTVSGDTVLTNYGYPAGQMTSTTLGVWMDVTFGPDWFFEADADNTNFSIHSGASANPTCAVTYTEASGAGASPVISIADTGC